jgi:NAD(P)H-dependent FMN reductase
MGCNGSKDNQDTVLILVGSSRKNSVNAGLARFIAKLSV